MRVRIGPPVGVQLGEPVFQRIVLGRTQGAGQGAVRLGRIRQRAGIRKCFLQFGVMQLRHVAIMPQARFLIALGRAGLYIFAMSDSNKNNFEIELKRLERQVDELIALLGQMREENRALRQRQESLATDRSSLVQKNEQVRTRVEAMIGRLKMLEHGA